MISHRLRLRLRKSLLPTMAVGLWLVYLVVLLPLEGRETRLQPPLEAEWRRLAAAVGQSNAASLNFQAIKDQLSGTVETKALLATTAQEVRARVDPGPELQQRILAPFQLVDYQNERGRCMERLTRLAKDLKVGLEPAVLAGLPEHTADVRSPELLWQALAMAEQLTTAAINVRVATVRALRFQSPLAGRPASVQTPTAAEIVVDLELVGDASKVLRFLAVLPLRADEIRAAGLPEAGPDKAAMFIDRIVLRKQTPGRAEEVHASIRVCAFVFRE